ncbi:MAG: esterase-like activity of phytase family protein, partial [Pseudolabrys sp.]|nr:esterase-like activity of phytase family protein [Pseudolabrys sp.]
EFRGALELTSPEREFGGLSALLIEPDGERFLSLSDKGRWFRGRIVYRNGRIAGMADVEIAPMLDMDGNPLSARGWFDTESLARDGGTVYVGIERVNQVVRFNFGKDGLLARGEPIALPPEAKSLPFNKGIEALAFIPPGQPLGGTLLAISERGLDRNGNIIAFLIGGPKPGSFTVRRIGDFDISDATVLPNGDVLLLERSYSMAKGVGMRMRRVRQTDIAPGAVVDGRVMVEADMGYQIDNMEGIAVHRNALGETILTLISDDNFSPIQRTLLMQFAVVGE